MPSAADHRIGVEGSLFAALRGKRPDVEPILASKASLVATSHLVEELVARAPGRAVLISGFQHGRNWAVERDRYLELAGGGEVIAVFAGEEPPAAWEVEHVGVRLQAGSALSQEWFVLALGVEVAVVLCGLDAVSEGVEPPAAEDEGDRLFEVVWSFDPELVLAAADVVVDAVAASAPERVHEVRDALARAQGQPMTVSQVAHGADNVVAGLLERIERLRRREKRVLRQANEAKTEFLSRMSHELRTPLNAILGFTQLLQLDERTSADRESLEHISRAGRHLLVLINEVLDISRIEAGRLALSLEPVRVADVVDECLALMRPLAAQRAITVEDETAGDDRHVLADRQRLSQVLLNLLSNAIKYNVEGGSVVVALHEDGESLVQIEVRDTGPGISAENIGRLFVPFERLSVEPGAAEGTGLGLALSQRMAQAMGGRIEVESRGDRGSSFSVLLPSAEALGEPAPAEPATPVTDSPAALTRHRVLYVEDNLSNLRLVERILATHGALDLVSTGSGEESLRLAAELQPALVLLDLHLPDLQGEEVLSRLRADPRTRALPVVIISADATPGQLARLEAAGAQATMTKPIDVRLLLDTVARLLPES